MWRVTVTFFITIITTNATWKPLCLQQLCSWRAELSSMHGTNTMQIFLFFLFNFYWSVVGVQYFVSFQCTAKWTSYTYVNIHSFLDSFPMSVITKYWIQFPVLYGSFLWVILYIVVSICQSQSPSLHTFLFFQIPQSSSPRCWYHRQCVWQYQAPSTLG